MSELLAPKVVDDPDYGRVVRIVDEHGIFAGYDVTPEQIASAAAEADISTSGGELIKLAEATRAAERADFQHGADELVRYYGRIAPGGRTEKAAIPLNFLSFGEIAVKSAEGVRRYLEHQGGNDD